MIAGIIDATLAVLRTVPEVAGEGGQPGATVSVYCEEIVYDEYDRKRDEATVKLKICVGIADANLQAGEVRIQNLAEKMRFALVRKYSLGGIAAASFVRRVEFVNADNPQELHGAVIDFEVIAFVERTEPLFAPEVLQIKIQSEGENG